MMLTRKFYTLILAMVLVILIAVVHFKVTPIIPRILSQYLGSETDPEIVPTSSLKVFLKPNGTVPPGIKLIPQPRIEITADLTPSEAEERYFKYVTREDIECTHTVRIGNPGDGGWNVCLEGPYKPSKPCVVYSFGINNDWSFDDEMSIRYGCEVRAFDPSMHIGDHKHSALVYFYETGLGGSNRKQSNGWKIKTLKTLLDQYNHNDKIIEYLKIDIEYSEWESFQAMFDEGALRNVKQFGFETHTHEVSGGKTSTVENFVTYWSLLDRLEKAGFRRWYWHFNQYGKYTSRHTGKGRTCCYEMVYINLNFLNIEVPPHPTPEPEKPTTSKTKAMEPIKVESAHLGEIILPPLLKFLPASTETVTMDMSGDTAEENFYKYVTTNDIECGQHERLGNFGDGGWDICTAGPYSPTQPCTVYSFGINNDWTFDDAISRKFKCNVKAFDPSMKVGDHQHSKLVYFYHTGIGGKNKVNANGWKIRTLKTLFKELGDSGKTVDMLKIDIEYNEWESFKTMFKEEALKRVKQFVFEIHTHELAGGRPSTVAEFVQYFNTLKTLENLGFKKWHNHFNPYGVYTSVRTRERRTCCYELYYININFLR